MPRNPDPRLTPALRAMPPELFQEHVSAPLEEVGSRAVPHAALRADKEFLAVVGEMRETVPFLEESLRAAQSPQVEERGLAKRHWKKRLRSSERDKTLLHSLAASYANDEDREEAYSSAGLISTLPLEALFQISKEADRALHPDKDEEMFYGIGSPEVPYKTRLEQAQSIDAASRCLNENVAAVLGYLIRENGLLFDGLPPPYQHGVRQWNRRDALGVKKQVEDAVKAEWKARAEEQPDLYPVSVIADLFPASVTPEQAEVWDMGERLPGEAGPCVGRLPSTQCRHTAKSPPQHPKVPM